MVAFMIIRQENGTPKYRLHSGDCCNEDCSFTKLGQVSWTRL